MTNTAATMTGSSAVSRKSFMHEQQPDGGAGADPGVPRERQREGDNERRHDERRPDPIPRSEHEPGGRHTDDEHQKARIRHVVAQRPWGRWPRLS